MNDVLVYPWREHEIALTAKRDYPAPYTGVNVQADFTHEKGTRMAFARSLWLISRGIKNSSRSLAPGWVGTQLAGKRATALHQLNSQFLPQRGRCALQRRKSNGRIGGFQ
jgi:hypothetical protein